MFCVDIFFVEEFFLLFGFDDFVEDCFFVVGGEFDCFVLVFYVFLEEVVFFDVGDVYVFEVDIVVVVFV